MYIYIYDNKPCGIDFETSPLNKTTRDHMTLLPSNFLRHGEWLPICCLEKMVGWSHASTRQQPGWKGQVLRACHMSVLHFGSSQSQASFWLSWKRSFTLWFHQRMAGWKIGELFHGGFLRSENHRFRWSMASSHVWLPEGTTLHPQINVWLVVWTPLKNISQLGWLFPIYGKIKHVPNHKSGRSLCPEAAPAAEA